MIFKKSITNPEPGPIALPVPEPVAHVVPRMAAPFHLVQVKPDCWRVTEVEIDPLMDWLPHELADKWPRLSEGSLKNLLRAAMSDRKVMLCRTENAVGLAYIVHDGFEPNGVAYEKFVRGNGQAADTERMLIYQFLRDWAKSSGTSEFLFNLDSDARMNQTSKGPGIKQVLMDVRKGSVVKDRSIHVAVFGEQ